MRLRYAQRHRTLVAALARELPAGGRAASRAGCTCSSTCRPTTDEAALLAAAARHGVAIEGLSLHSYTGDCPPGLVLGHACMAEAALERGVALLRQAAADS